MNKKCIVLTTINKPSQQILSYIEKYSDWDLIIVGDNKTPDSKFENINCIYLSISKQNEIFPQLSELIPKNSYARKNLGYAYAFINNYDIVYDTDDDNFSEITDDHERYNTKEVSSNNNFVNIYKLYTDKKVWPRGLPLRHIDSEIFINDTKYICPVIQGLVDGDPDVDAIFRLTNSLESEKFTKFNPANTETCSLKPYTFCPFNTQNTYWTRKELFHLMYLPSTVSMRFTDILRGYIVEHQLWRRSLNIKFTNSTAIQTRNEHNIVKDLNDEIEMFQYTESIIEWLIQNKNIDVIKIYEWLVSKNIVSQLELDILKEWYNIFKPLHKKFLYMYQSETYKQDYIESNFDRDIKCISYQNQHPESIFLPNSTWTDGRNKMIEYALIKDITYDYVCFMDDDISFIQGNFESCENDIMNHNYSIYIPQLKGYPYTKTQNLKKTYTLWFDAICNYFKFDLLRNNKIFPYKNNYDHVSWWCSQLILIFEIALEYPCQVVVSKINSIKNNLSRNYPRQDKYKDILKQYFKYDIENSPKIQKINEIIIENSQYL